MSTEKALTKPLPVETNPTRPLYESDVQRLVRHEEVQNKGPVKFLYQCQVIIQLMSLVSSPVGHKNKNLRNLYDYEGLMPVELAKVEPQRIELWSREENTVLSTCLFDFYCREKQGSQQPKLHLSYCVLTALSNIARSSSAKRHRIFSTRKPKVLSDDGLPLLKRDKL